jgi:hypothetical protein
MRNDGIGSCEISFPKFLRQNQKGISQRGLSKVYLQEPKASAMTYFPA